MQRHPQWRWLWLAVLVVVFDLASKAWVSSVFQYGERWDVLPVFQLTLLHNTGAAFSFLADHDGWQRWLFALIGVVAVVGILIWLGRLKRHETILALGLTLILGGAIGNLHDRLMLGYVVDFLAFHWQYRYFPAFNLADSAITLGAILIGWDLMFGGQNVRHKTAEAKSSPTSSQSTSPTRKSGHK
ncbi:signal peptidase II [Terasakiispira papahanaumokuakeensis]|uniref:Lipoprotein signal peptidase n=1 Tax=Terasakiispira papahanaumokuakeensis TaxID=197479 RepID=A0A1E2VER0_9GAMM|nr:signal peptidase II [Terasakiispira papahanaumokuakeensis]